MQSPNLSDGAKEKFIDGFLSDQAAPTVLPVTINTSSSLTASGEGSAIRANQFDKPATLIGKAKTAVKRFVMEAIAYAAKSAACKLAGFVVAIAAIWLAIKVAYAVFKKVFIQTTR